MKRTATFRVLFVGDVYGWLGLSALSRFIGEEKQKLGWDFVVANGENTDGLGTAPEHAEEMLSLGVDCITGGNHTFANDDIARILQSEPRAIRPANYPDGTPGRGVFSSRVGGSIDLSVVNLMARELIDEDLLSPFETIDRVLDSEVRQDSIVVVDLHGESSFEKQSIFHYTDGRVAAVIGTHTHVQTADERVSKAGTAYITDIGMTGPADSIAGVIPSDFIDYYRRAPDVRLRGQTAGGTAFCGALVSIDPETRKAKEIVRLRQDYECDDSR